MTKVSDVLFDYEEYLKNESCIIDEMLSESKQIQDLPDPVQEAIYAIGWSAMKVDDIKATGSSYEVYSKNGSIDWAGLQKLVKFAKKAKFYEIKIKNDGLCLVFDK